MFRKSIELGLLNMASYFVLTCDIRSVSQGNIPYAIVVNLIISLLSFTIFKRLQQAEGWRDQLCFSVFGTVGTVIGIILTKALFGH